MSKTDGYREYEVMVGKHKYAVVVDTGAWLNYMVASIFEQVKDRAPENIVEMGGYDTSDVSKQSIDASGNPMTRLGYAVIRENLMCLDGVSVQVTRRYEILQVCIVPVILGLQTVTKEQIMMDVNEGGNDECLIIRRPKISKIPLMIFGVGQTLKTSHLLSGVDGAGFWVRVPVALGAGIGVAVQGQCAQGAGAGGGQLDARGGGGGALAAGGGFSSVLGVWVCWGVWGRDLA